GEPSAGQESHRRQGAKHIELLPGKEAVEEENHQNPQRAEKPGLTPVFRLRRRSDPQGSERKCTPGYGPQQEQRPEDQQRNPAAGQRRQQGFGVCAAARQPDGEMPRHHDQQKQQNGGNRVPAQQMLQIARPEQVQDRNCEREQDTGNARAQHSQPAGGGKAERTGPQVFLLAEGPPEKVDGESGPQTEKDVPQKQMSEKK